MSRSFVLVLLQRIEAESIYTKPLLTALRDVEKLFLQARPSEQLKFTTLYLAPSLPSQELRTQPRIDWARVEQVLRRDEWWGAARQRVQKIDQEALLPKVRKLTHTEPDEHLIVAVNASITPPRNWSYALWDILDHRNAAIGISPMSPQYWGLTSGNRMERVAAVSARLRTTIAAVVGRQLGYETCANPSCFMFDPVTSVSQLDEMRELGREHLHRADLDSLDFGASSGPDGTDESAEDALEDVL